MQLSDFGLAEEDIDKLHLCCNLFYNIMTKHSLIYLELNEEIARSLIKKIVIDRDLRKIGMDPFLIKVMKHCRGDPIFLVDNYINITWMTKESIVRIIQNICYHAGFNIQDYRKYGSASSYDRIEIIDIIKPGKYCWVSMGTEEFNHFIKQKNIGSPSKYTDDLGEQHYVICGHNNFPHVLRPVKRIKSARSVEY